MNYRRLSEHDLSDFVENLRDRLTGSELSAIDPSVRAALVAEIGTLPELLASQTAAAAILKDQRKAAVTDRNATRFLAREVSARVRAVLKAQRAPRTQFEICGFDGPAEPVTMRVAQNPTELSAEGYSYGVNGLKFIGNNEHGTVSYEIWRRESRDAKWEILATTKKRSFKDRPVTPGQFYEYKVRAVAPKSVSSFSNPAIVYGEIQARGR